MPITPYRNPAETLLEKQIANLELALNCVTNAHSLSNDYFIEAFLQSASSDINILLNHLRVKLKTRQQLEKGRENINNNEDL